MARIRTIKPEFWTDEKIVALSIPARLLFIGIWNFTDDSGSIEFSTPQIKLRVLPADPVDISPLINELIAHGLLHEYESDGKKYLNVKNFALHQVINRPSKNKFPEPPLTDGREGKGREKEGKNTYADFVLLTETEHQRLVERFGGTEANARIARLNNYLGSKGVKYKSHYHTILSWASRDKQGIPDTPSPEKKAELERCVYGKCEKKGTVTMNNAKYCREHLEMYERNNSHHDD